MGIFFPFLYCVHGVKHGGRLTMEKITWDFRLRISRSHVRLAPGRRENQLVKSLQFFLLDDDEDDGVFLPRLAMSVSIFTFYSAMYKKKKNLFRRLSPSLRHRPPAAIRPERIPSVLVARVDVHAYRVLPFAWRKSIDIVRRVVRSLRLPSMCLAASTWTKSRVRFTRTHARAISCVFAIRCYICLAHVDECGVT